MDIQIKATIFLKVSVPVAIENCVGGVPFWVIIVIITIDHVLSKG